MTGVTLDVLIKTLTDQPAWKQYEEALVLRREKCAAMLISTPVPNLSTEMVHALLGEIRGINFALQQPDRLFRQSPGGNGKHG